MGSEMCIRDRLPSALAARKPADPLDFSALQACLRFQQGGTCGSKSIARHSQLPRTSRRRVSCGREASVNYDDVNPRDPSGSFSSYFISVLAMCCSAGGFLFAWCHVRFFLAKPHLDHAAVDSFGCGLGKQRTLCLPPGPCLLFSLLCPPSLHALVEAAVLSGYPHHPQPHLQSADHHPLLLDN